jgi:acyl carrier protein
MIDEIRQFVLDSLTAMNYSIEDIDDDTALGPAGADLESLALAELAGMTVGEFCATVQQRIASAAAH